MKTPADIQSEMERIRRDNATELGNTTVSDKLLFLKNCKLYLDGNPTLEFVQKQLREVSNKVTLIEAGYSDWMANTPNTAQYKNPEQWYGNMMGKMEFRAQVKMLEHIL